MNTLDQLREHSIVVADTADFRAIDVFKPFLYKLIYHCHKLTFILF